jgi:hypothetical protein
MIQYPEGRVYLDYYLLCDNRPFLCWRLRLGESEKMAVKVNVSVTHLYLPVSQRIAHQLRKELRHSTAKPHPSRSFLLAPVARGHNGSLCFDS